MFLKVMHIVEDDNGKKEFFPTLVAIEDIRKIAFCPDSTAEIFFKDYALTTEKKEVVPYEPFMIVKCPPETRDKWLQLFKERDLIINP